MFLDFNLLQNQRAFSIDNSIIARLQKNEPMNFPNFPDYFHHFPQLFGDLPQQFERRFLKKVRRRKITVVNRKRVSAIATVFGGRFDR